MKEIILYFKRNFLSLVIFILIISFSQSLILKPHLEFGFSPDDVRFFSDFSALGTPFSKLSQAWQATGIYQTPHVYYGGILFSLFGFNYFSYQITSLIFKILSIITFYLLIQIVFRNRLLSFISGLTFSFLYSSFGSMEMVTRTQDYLLISGLNIFFILFYLIFTNRLNHIFWTIFSSIVLLSTFLINPIRAYPILTFICFLGIIFFLKKKSKSNYYTVIKHLFIIFLPFILFVIFTGRSGASFGNAPTIIQKISVGNLQMLLAPFSSFGSLFLQNDSLGFLSSPTWTLSDFLSYFLGGPLIIFGITTLILSFIFSNKPLKFFLSVFTTNFFLELLIFFAIDTGRNLPDSLKMTYDAYTFTPAAVLGGYILTLTAFIFIEWLNNKQNEQVLSFRNKLLVLYLLGITFSATSVWLTWIVYSEVHIPMGIYGYSTIPSMGISVAISSIVVLAYLKIKNQRRFLKAFAPSVFLVLVFYFFYSNYRIQIYLKENQDYGNKASDQMSLKNKFWSFLKDDTPCNNFFFFETTPNELNGLNYSFIMLDRFDRWYSLYSLYHSKKPCPVAWLVSDEEKLLSSYKFTGEKEGFLYNDSNGENKFFSLENFYAFKLQNRDIIDIKPEILKKLRLSPE